MKGKENRRQESGVWRQDEDEKQELKAEYPISNTEYPTDEGKAGRQKREERS